MDETKRAAIIDKALHLSQKAESFFTIRVIQDGLVTMIPILMIGAFALVLKSFPVDAYQLFIQETADGFIYSFFHMIYQATFGVMSLYMVICFSVSFFSLKAPAQPVNMWGVCSAMASFLIMIGAWSGNFYISELGANSAFLAIASSIVSSWIFYTISYHCTQNEIIYFYGADSRLSNTMKALLPATATVAVAALLAYSVTLFGNVTMHETITGFFVYAFNFIDGLFAKGLCFIFVSSLLWLFGIHGSDCLQGVSDKVFQPLMDANVMAVTTGGTPSEILCKPFFDCFILMGGCGSSLCLFLSILLFSRDKSLRALAKPAGLPLIFNISELLVFGLPVIFNPIMAIPFLLVPVLQYLVAYAAIAAGLVPPITVSIEWTTPVLISGFAATGSIEACLLQLFNLLMGVAIYTPFVKIMGGVRERRQENHQNAFVDWFIKNEGSLTQTKLLGLSGLYGDVAKRLAIELKDSLKAGRFELFYQPQYNYDGKCIGVESLLRWPAVKPLNVYPPLLVRLALEQGILLDMETAILKRAVSEREKIFNQFGRGIKISVNATGNSISKPAYWDYLKALWKNDPFREGSLCVEVTEQDAVVFSEEIIAEFRSCKKMGIKFAIDDFSAGQTSMEYLKNGIFDMLKIDGALVKVINQNPSCRAIIASLASLSNSLHIDCLAEYVENEAIRQALHEAGCDLYQGYLFSPAVPLKQEEKEH